MSGRAAEPARRLAASRAAEVIQQLDAEGEPTVRAALAECYGIRTDRAVGIPMRRR